MKDEAREFRNKMAGRGRQEIPHNVYNNRRTNEREVKRRNHDSYMQGRREGSRISREAERKYRSKKGSAYKASQRAKKQALKTKLKIATLLLTAGIGIAGSINYVKNHDNDLETTVTKLQDMGYDNQTLGMSNQTVETIEKYDEYFERFSNSEKGKINITDNEIIDKIHEIKGLNQAVVKEKMAKLEGTNSQNVTINYGNSSDIGDYVSIKIDKQDDKVSYNNDNGIILGLGKKNNFPKEMTNLVMQLERYEELEEKLKTDSISKYNAIAEMKKLYVKISDFATKALIKDEKGNISLMDYLEKENYKEDNER